MNVSVCDISKVLTIDLLFKQLLKRMRRVSACATLDLILYEK